MRTIRYAPQRQALYHPERDPSLLSSGVSPQLDALCAEMSRLAYRRFETDSAEAQFVTRAVGCAGYDQTAFFSSGSSQAFAAANTAARSAILAFRGTQSDDLRDLITDARFHPVPWPAGGMVHSGFADAANALLDHGVRAWLQEHAGWNLVHTGHSLGAAVATLTASTAPPRHLVTFGSPRVGDGSFAQTLDGTEVRRYVDCCDLVTRVPPPGPAYGHVGVLRYVDRRGIVGGIDDADAIDHDQDMGRLDYFHDYALVPEDVAIRDLADHAPANYVYALFGTPA